MRQTRAEMDAKHKAMVERMHAESRAHFEKAQPGLDADYAALPSVFQRRIDRFRASSPDWRWEYEAYEMSVCTDAVKIARFALAKTLSGESIGLFIKRFAGMSWDEQRAMIPDLFEGHSGNSFGFAVRLAHHYVTEPDFVWREHGALAALVGCDAYGCPPVTGDV